jgi:hypothetical protein
MQEKSVKNSIRSFGVVKSNKSNIMSASDASNLSLQLSRIGKMLDESVLKFTKRYLIIQTELEEMKREFIGDVSLISEYLNLTKKEIRYDKFDDVVIGKYANPINIPKIPNYERKILTRRDKKINKSHNYNNSNINLNYSRKPNLNKISNVNMNKNIISNKISSSGNKRMKVKEEKNENEESKTKNLNNQNKEEILDSLPDNQTKAIYILLNSDVVPYEEKLKLLSTKKVIYSQITPNDIYKNTLQNIENKINSLKLEPIEEEEKKIVEKISSYPSKTAKTGLNFLNNQKENELMIENELNEKLLEMICVCLDENLIENQGENIKETYEKIFKKYNVNSIKDLFFDVIYKRIYSDALNDRLNVKEIEKIINCISENKMLISENLVSNENKIFSYVAFSLDEILEFLTGIQELDDDLKEKIKNEIEVKNLLEEESKIRNLIDN